MSEIKFRPVELQDIEKLNEAQRGAYKKIIDFIEDPDRRMFCFEGFSGVGKSYTTNTLVENLICQYGFDMEVATPTHKALRVITNMAEFKSDCLDYSTIHSLLGLKPVVSSYGDETFVKDKKNKNRVGDYDIIFIDEASMLQDQIFVYLLEELGKHPSLKIIFIGDGKQLAPVKNHTYDKDFNQMKKKFATSKKSIPMDEGGRKKFGIGHTILTEIVRQKGTNPIIELTADIRSGVFEPKTKLNENGEGVVVIKKDNYKRVLNKMFCSDKYDENPDYCRTVAWKNVVVNNYNEQIRKMIYKEKIRDRLQELKDVEKAEMVETIKHEFPYYVNGRMNLPKYVVGDKLIVDKPVFDDDTQQILFQTSEELLVKDIFIETKMGMGDPYKCYTLQVKNIFDGHEHIIEAIHEDDEPKFEMRLDKLREIAKKKKQGTNDARLKWVGYYTLEKRFARLKYAPCLTTHKSQGSTYENIVVVVPDIMMNPNFEERMQLLYVAISRASKRAFLLI